VKRKVEIKEMPSKAVLEAFLRGMLGGRATVLFLKDRGKFVTLKGSVVEFDKEK